MCANPLPPQESDENVKFLRAIDLYSKMAEPAVNMLCMEAADMLKAWFFVPNAELELNVTGVANASITAAIDGSKATPSTFNEARLQVMRLLSQDSFARFVETTEFRLTVAALKTREEEMTPKERSLGAFEKDLSLVDVEPALEAERAKMVAAKKRGSQSPFSIVIVGTGGTGKSTIVKQFRLLHGAGFSVGERRAWAQRIRSNMLADAHYALRKASVSPNQPGGLTVELRLIDALFSAMTGPVALQLQSLRQALNVPGFLPWLDMISPCLTPMASYFWKQTDRILDLDYMPSDQDVIYCPSSTLGVASYDFSARDSDFHLVDCGGQRSQRKKWLHFFSAATAVLFVASVDDFWHTLSEDETANSLREAIDVFAETINSPSLRNRSVLLFLNKSDLLPASLEDHDFGRYFPEYEGDARDPKAVSSFIKQRFLGVNASSERERTIMAVATTASCAREARGLARIIEESLLHDVVAESGM